MHMDCFVHHGREVEGLWPEQVEAGQGCGVMFGGQRTNPIAFKSDLVHAIQAFLKAAANEFKDLSEGYNRHYFDRMKDWLAMKVARHGGGSWSDLLTPEKAESLLSEHRWKATVILACLLYTSPSPRDLSTSRMPSSA